MLTGDCPVAKDTWDFYQVLFFTGSNSWGSLLRTARRFLLPRSALHVFATFSSPESRGPQRNLPANAGTNTAAGVLDSCRFTLKRADTFHQDREQNPLARASSALSIASGMAATRCQFAD